MFEAVGVTVSRLIRTRFGDIVLPRTLRRGRWDELDASLVTALMVQLGLLREDDDSSGGNRRRSKQPQSHDSALPPGFGTMDRNGMNGARIGRRGKLQGGRQGSAGQAAACPSDPFGTGLMIAGGYANGHPLASGGSVDGNRKGRQARRPRRRVGQQGRGQGGRQARWRQIRRQAARQSRGCIRRARRASGLLAGGGGAAAGAGRRAASSQRRQGDRQAGGCARQSWRRQGGQGRSRRQQGRRVARRGQGAGGQAGKSAGQGGNKSRSSRGSRREAMIGSRAAARTSRAWACSVAAGVVRALSPGRRLLEVVPPSWRSGCWRGLPADSSRLIVSP